MFRMRGTAPHTARFDLQESMRKMAGEGGVKVSDWEVLDEYNVRSDAIVGTQCTSDARIDTQEHACAPLQ